MLERRAHTAEVALRLSTTEVKRLRAALKAATERSELLDRLHANAQDQLLEARVEVDRLTAPHEVVE
jgi:hypothetical protein